MDRIEIITTVIAGLVIVVYLLSIALGNPIQSELAVGIVIAAASLLFGNRLGKSRARKEREE